MLPFCSLAADWPTAPASCLWTPASYHMFQHNIWKTSPIHQVCHILHSICYLLYSVMALESIFINIYIYKKKKNWQFFSLELLKAISLKYLKSLMVRFISSYKIKIPFEFFDVQKERWTIVITESVCYSEYLCHHCSNRKSVFKIQNHITRTVTELFGKWLFFENGTWRRHLSA